MNLQFFSRKPPLDEASVEWIFSVFEWGLRHLGSEPFYAHTTLVTPDNRHFPGRADSVAELAGLMFERSRAYAGMQHWPIVLMPPGSPLPDVVPQITTPTPLRMTGFSEHDAAMMKAPTEAHIPVSYDPKMVNNPAAMIAGFAQVFAHYLGSAVTAEPPGGVRNWPQTTEVIGVFLGFGVLFANTAYNYQPRSCGSCGGPPVERQVNLSQFDVSYALALFCVLKNISNREVMMSLKSSLKSYFKRCRRDVESRTELLVRLQPPRLPGQNSSAA